MSRLQMIPERAYMEIFRDIVDEYLSEVTEAFPGLLSPAAEEGLEKAFCRADLYHKPAERFQYDIGRRRPAGICVSPDSDRPLRSYSGRIC